MFYLNDLVRIVAIVLKNFKMNIKHKKNLQTLFCALLLAYTTLLLYQSFSSGAELNRLGSDAKLTAKKYNYERNLAEEVPSTNNDNSMYENVPTTEIPSATATIKPPTTVLDDVFISVKTTKNYHNTRLSIILKTWFQLAKKQTFFFTDADDVELQSKINGHLINTHCPSSHHRKALSCKMSVEFDTFLGTNKRWFCHFDDDNYVNVPRLVRFLGDYNPREDWYFGKTSIKAPLKIQKATFWFATGGAGFCLSRALALKMMPFASQGRFMSTAEKMQIPDDVTMGYIIEYLLKIPLTVVELFHSHLEPMKFIRRSMLEDQISFGYSKREKNIWNVLKIQGFDEKYDYSRFFSLHCFLFPHFNFCSALRQERSQKEKEVIRNR